jgi:hypothetical protein
VTNQVAFCVVPGCGNTAVQGDLCNVHLPDRPRKDLIFDHDRWNKLLADTVKQITHLAASKGGEYSGDFDRLANFRRNAERLGLSMEHVWAVYSAKHWDALMQFVQDLSIGKERPRSEPLQGRCDDLIVYLILFKAMLEEREARPVPGTAAWTLKEKKV